MIYLPSYCTKIGLQFEKYINVQQSAFAVDPGSGSVAAGSAGLDVKCRRVVPGVLLGPVRNNI